MSCPFSWKVRKRQHCRDLMPRSWTSNDQITASYTSSTPTPSPVLNPCRLAGRAKTSCWFISRQFSIPEIPTHRLTFIAQLLESFQRITELFFQKLSEEVRLYVSFFYSSFKKKLISVLFQIYKSIDISSLIELISERK